MIASAKQHCLTNSRVNHHRHQAVGAAAFQPRAHVTREEASEEEHQLVNATELRKIPGMGIYIAIIQRCLMIQHAIQESPHYSE